jgi:hypothetical protein
MFTGRFFRSSCLGAILRVLALEAVLVALSWLLYHQVGSKQSLHFSDVLFITGILVCFVAAYGMIRNPYSEFIGPFAPHIRTSEEEHHEDLLESLMKQKSGSMHLFTIGVLAILLSVFFTYGLHI